MFDNKYIYFKSGIKNIRVNWPKISLTVKTKLKLKLNVNDVHLILAQRHFWNTNALKFW